MQTNRRAGFLKLQENFHKRIQTEQLLYQPSRNFSGKWWGHTVPLKNHFPSINTLFWQNFGRCKITKFRTVSNSKQNKCHLWQWWDQQQIRSIANKNFSTMNTDRLHLSPTLVDVTSFHKNTLHFGQKTPNWQVNPRYHSTEWHAHDEHQQNEQNIRLQKIVNTV